MTELTRLRGPEVVVEADGSVRERRADSGRYRTTFSTELGSLHATIRAEDGSTRELRAPGPDCRALASASAVAVALMLDAEPKSTHEEPTPIVGQAKAPSVAAPTRSAHIARADERALRRSLRAGAGAGLMLGIPRDLAPTVLGELALQRGRVRAALGVLWALPKRDPFMPGQIRSALIAGDVRLCFAVLPHVSLCSGAYLGQHDMRAFGYTRNEQRHFFWGAAPVELALESVWAHVGTELGLGALIPFQRSTFSIDGLGSAQTDWPIQALFALRVFGLTNL